MVSNNSVMIAAAMAATFAACGSPQSDEPAHVPRSGSAQGTLQMRDPSSPSTSGDLELTARPSGAVSTTSPDEHAQPSEGVAIDDRRFPINENVLTQGRYAEDIEQRVRLGPVPAGFRLLRRRRAPEVWEVLHRGRRVALLRIQNVSDVARQPGAVSGLPSNHTRRARWNGAPIRIEVHRWIVGQALLTLERRPGKALWIESHVE